MLKQDISSTIVRYEKQKYRRRITGTNLDKK